MPILGPGSFLELGQKDPRVLGLGVCPELTEEEMSELRGVLEKEGLDNRKKELNSQESTIRVYAKSLEDKENKLDIYAERVKKMLSSLKPE